MRVVSMLATKGGVGKTTLTAHWAVEALSRYQNRVAILDTDPQGSATRWRERRQDENPPVLKARAGQFGDALAACREGGMEMVLLDTRPSIEEPALEAAREAISLSDLIVVPCGPMSFDMDAIGISIDLAQRAGKPTVIVLTRGRPGSPINNQAKKALEAYGAPICPITIMNRAALADATLTGKAVREIAPQDKGTEEIANSWEWIETQLQQLEGKKNG
jgi:chromosome partitioning protein